jgi:hypothetical protein
MHTAVTLWEMPVVITDVTNQIQIPVVTAVMTNPAPLPFIIFAQQTQLAGNNTTEWLTTLVNALAYQAIGVNDLLARTHGHTLFDNSNTMYSSAIPGEGRRSGTISQSGPTQSGRVRPLRLRRGVYAEQLPGPGSLGRHWREAIIRLGTQRA